VLKCNERQCIPAVRCITAGRRAGIEETTESRLELAQTAQTFHNIARALWWRLKNRIKTKQVTYVIAMFIYGQLKCLNKYTRGKDNETHVPVN